MGVARGGGVVGGPAPASTNEKAKELMSSLLKLASSAMNGLKAVFAECVAEGDRVLAKVPGMKSVEVPNQTIPQLQNEGLRFRDVIKQMGLVALGFAFKNPIPITMAMVHADNLAARLKAKEKEIAKKAKADAKKGGKAARTKVIKNEAAIKQVKILERKMELMRKQNSVIMQRVEKHGGRVVTAADRQSASAIKSQFVKLGFSQKDAQKAVNATLHRISPSEADKFMAAALKEVSALKKG